MLTTTGSRGWARVSLGLVLILVAFLVTGCFLVAGKGPKTTGTETGTSGGTPPSGETLAGEIPPGRSFAEGGGGPKSYTFREEWRTALAKAREWRSGAYLITAAGDMINNEGVPSSWTMHFIDKPADTVLIVEIDPWGSVTNTREITGDGVKSFVTQYTKPIPFKVVDSDQVVTAATAALAADYPPDKTKDPRAGLNFSVQDGSGPWWYYTVFYKPDARYVTVAVDAMTGEAKIQPAAPSAP